ncbi:hypothetical protein MOX02_43490 [Methylobacterium oxalidis]|uniref:Uncharacterized protein n=1 Tax=Methylobacterium oxalidis TaxID=944322 RepID=A0A512J8M2_9HYPH|nr:hypothetical protein MOX02_43490 [Methylobacterium oxalidis]GLS64360.1 hypothetical protein GCM10007888_27410 [Methylobacterium oxalidis]
MGMMQRNLLCHASGPSQYAERGSWRQGSTRGVYRVAVSGPVARWASGAGSTARVRWGSPGADTTGRGQSVSGATDAGDAHLRRSTLSVNG